MLDVVASNRENELLPIEYWEISFEEGEFLKENYDLKENSFDFEKEIIAQDVEVKGVEEQLEVQNEEEIMMKETKTNI